MFCKENLVSSDVSRTRKRFDTSSCDERNKSEELKTGEIPPI